MSGLELIHVEMLRQHADALSSLQAGENRAVAAKVAASLKRTGRLRLLGMGGSHHVGRTVLFAYRALGLDVSADVLSEALVAPLPDHPRTALITSQSGASGEVVLYLNSQPAGQEERFGLTLEAGSPLGTAVPCLVGHGGTEVAFAATRSLLITLALHVVIMQQLGAPVDGVVAALSSALAASVAAAAAAPASPLATPVSAEAEAFLRQCGGDAGTALMMQAAQRAVDALDRVTAIVLSGRAETQGVAEIGALCVMELARVPAFALEGGQLRHGPLEMLSASTGVIILRAAGAGSTLTPSLVEACVATGAQVVVMDLSGEPALAGVHTVTLPKAGGMEAVFRLLPLLQGMLIEVARRRVAKVGEPLRVTKVTREV